MKKITSSLRHVLFLAAVLCLSASNNDPPPPHPTIGTELDCDFTIVYDASGGSCGASSEPLYTGCVPLNGPGTVSLTLPAGVTVVQKMDLYCGYYDCISNPPLVPLIAHWDCANGTTTGTCCETEVGIDWDGQNGWRIE